jgi:hypothetical protein
MRTVQLVFCTLETKLTGFYLFLLGVSQTDDDDFRLSCSLYSRSNALSCFLPDGIRDTTLAANYNTANDDLATPAVNTPTTSMEIAAYATQTEVRVHIHTVPHGNKRNAFGNAEQDDFELAEKNIWRRLPSIEIV